MMQSSTAGPLTNQDVVDLEQRFWDAMLKKDARDAWRMAGDKCVIVDASGVNAVDREAFARLATSAPYELRSFRIDPDSTRVEWVSDNLAFLAYRVHEDVDVDGDRVSMDAFNSSVWQRQSEGWRCILHTESIAGDSFGRDRQPR
jgi:hypothetical protein